MSKIDLSLNLKLKNSDCDSVTICQSAAGADAGDMKKETLEIAASSSSVVYDSSSADKVIYIESDSAFQVDINDLGPVDVKPLLAGSKTLKATLLSKLTITKLEILNPSATDSIKISYVLA